MTEPVTIFVEAEPSGTTVFVDGNSRGMAPMNIRGLPGQDFDLKLMRNGFETFKTRVTFPEEALTKRSFNLWPTPEVENQVMVSISTTPPGAQVVRDKLHLGSAPFRFKLGRGDEPFKIELRMPGHETMEVMLDPGSGDQAISVPLEVIAETRGGHSQRSKGEHSAGAKVKTGKARSVKPQLPSEKTLERKRYRIVE
jgi:hypothetical protein